MIRPDLSHCQTLQQFQESVLQAQQSAHGTLYTSHHNILSKLSKECKIIKELGVCQGATLSTMLLTKPKQIIGIDITKKDFLPYESLFLQFALDNDISFKFIEGSSLDSNLVSEVDLLHIDSLHTYKHLIAELKIHAPYVKKYIVCHDTCNTAGSKNLLKAIAEYITEYDQSWKIIDHFIHSVGYTVLQKEIRIT